MRTCGAVLDIVIFVSHGLATHALTTWRMSRVLAPIHHGPDQIQEPQLTRRFSVCDAAHIDCRGASVAALADATECSCASRPRHTTTSQHKRGLWASARRIRDHCSSYAQPNTTFGLVRICPRCFFRHLIQCQSSGWSSYSHTISSSASSSEISISAPTAVPSCCFFLLEALFRLRCGLPSLGKLMASKKASLSI